MECAYRWFLYSSAIISHTGVDPFNHPCVARALIFSPSLLFTHCVPDANQPACCVSLSVSFVCICLIVRTPCCAQQDLYGVRNNFHLMQSSPEVSEHVGQITVHHTEPNRKSYLFLGITGHLKRWGSYYILGLDS